MNAISEPQIISGGHWLQATEGVLLEVPQESTPLAEGGQRVATFDDLETQMTAFEAQHEAVVNELRRTFVMPDESSVVTFLSEHRTIPQILSEAATHLRACFGTGAVFNLRVPIDESGSRTLYAVVMWPGKLRDVREALAKFDDRWWIAHSRQTSGYLTFTYELM